MMSKVNHVNDITRKHKLVSRNKKITILLTTEWMSKFNTSSTAFSLRRSEFLRDLISASASPSSLSLSVFSIRKIQYQIPKLQNFQIP